MNESKKCPVCGEALIGRSDKKYCSADCRFAAHNKLKHESEQLLLHTNKCLRKNRSILKSLSPEGMTVIRMNVLNNLGFEFQYYTSIYVNDRRQIYYFSYDFGFTPIYHNGHKKVMIVKAQPYMRSPDPWKYARR